VLLQNFLCHMNRIVAKKLQISSSKAVLSSDGQYASGTNMNSFFDRLLNELAEITAILWWRPTNGLTLAGLPLFVFSICIMFTGFMLNLLPLVVIFTFFAACGLILLLDDLVLNERVTKFFLKVSEEEVNEELGK